MRARYCLLAVNAHGRQNWVFQHESPSKASGFVYSDVITDSRSLALNVRMEGRAASRDISC
jgi:hypothetical protein